MQSPQILYNELSYYTLSHNDSSFIHQHIVDAYTAQTADKNTKTIAITFALAGLYLFLEKNFTGKQVQKMHMRMAKTKKSWPLFVLPVKRGKITIYDVVSAAPGNKRDTLIKEWCKSVWDAYKNSHEEIAKLLEGYLV